jgi:hypothetical protein
LDDDAFVQPNEDRADGQKNLSNVITKICLNVIGMKDFVAIVIALITAKIIAFIRISGSDLTLMLNAKIERLKNTNSLKRNI